VGRHCNDVFSGAAVSMFLAVSYGLVVGVEIMAIPAAVDTDLLVLGEGNWIIFSRSYLVIMLIFLVAHQILNDAS
jgi:hypothetical protein